MPFAVESLPDVFYAFEPSYGGTCDMGCTDGQRLRVNPAVSLTTAPL